MSIEISKVWKLIERGRNAATFRHANGIEVYINKEGHIDLSCVDAEGDNTSVHICDLDKFATDVAELRYIYFTQE